MVYHRIPRATFQRRTPFFLPQKARNQGLGKVFVFFGASTLEAPTLEHIPSAVEETPGKRFPVVTPAKKRRNSSGRTISFEALTGEGPFHSETWFCLG